jgi:Na+-translocating ferredoxin:NAD+ oxidoreductase RNF subunit RnfB
MSTGFSRRHLFSMIGRTFRATTDRARTPREKTAAVGRAPSASATEAIAKVAVIQGRFCLAYTSFCTVCSERCPAPGAMKVEHGIPMVVSDVCTGCAVCHDVCPAPTNAVLVIPRRRNPCFAVPPPASVV